jgi:hypothetical protein
VPTPINPTIHTFTSLTAAYKCSFRKATCGDAPPDEQTLERSSFSSSESHLESEGELGRIQMIKGYRYKAFEDKDPTFCESALVEVSDLRQAARPARPSM